MLIEERDPRVPDDELAWGPASGPSGFQNAITMTAATAGTSDEVTWSATVQLPAGNTNPLRLAFEDFERIEGGDGGGRLTYTETIPV